MTFEEWWAEKDRVYANEYSTFKSVSAESWNASRNSVILEGINILEKYEIPVGNSAAGEMACEMTYEALKDIREEIRGLINGQL